MKTLKYISLALLLIAMGCAPQAGFQVSSKNISNNPQDGGGDDSGPLMSWDQISQSTNGTSDTGNSLLIRVLQESQSIELIVPFPLGFMISIPETEISDLPGATIRSELDSDGKELLIAKIPIKHILKDSKLGPVTHLPNGDPIPFIPSGELKGLSVHIPVNNTKLVIYLTVNAAAVFIETPGFEVPISFGKAIRNSTKTQLVGWIGYVAQKNGHSGGIYVATRLSDAVARSLNRLVQF